MKTILGTSNLGRRPLQRDLKSQGARLTEALARRAAGSEEDETPEPKPTLRSLRGKENAPKPSKVAGKQPKNKPEAASPGDPLAWAKAAATMRGWKSQRRGWTC